MTKHVQSIKGRPVFYFEVKFVGKIPADSSDTKSKDFAVGLSTAEFCGAKIVGANKESIGLCGDGKIYFNDNSNTNKCEEANQGEFKFSEGMVLGVGFVLKSKEVFFTHNG